MPTWAWWVLVVWLPLAALGAVALGRLVDRAERRRHRDTPTPPVDPPD